MSARWTLRRLVPLPVRVALRSAFLRTRSSASQFGQDFWVFGEAFDGERGGYFVDVGAADGMTLSNTFLLEKRFGWRGLCIEANPRLFERLRRSRGCTCVNVCVDAAEGSVDFALRKLLSGIVGAEPAPPDAGDLETVRLPTRPLAAILRESGAPDEIDYLSIDIEGSEERALRDFPFDEYRFRCMTIERPTPVLREVLADRGYFVVREVAGLDTFFIHESFEAAYQRNAYAFWKRARSVRIL